ncbi:TetR family transcriptional regulator [Promicromonospora sp. AC04]|uniref:TetR/AcrR family transcriptional regulator n=1 Tax=Promicromonospora sp. AC04 TaxID=2135723 RepID=UPI000D39759C|nr:TetR/AcrR family transcriptional regulator [Promicromonospora sp. AC04]PUB26276.1 TetR family transcriptional regulator [Promicromonospora sp. AC04]
MPVDDDDTRPLTRRERVRRQTVDEIVERALELVDAGGAHSLSLASVGKAMGMTSPALYHYFASREALLDALVVAGYTDLGTAVEGAAHEAADRPAPDRLAAVAHAWRRWALDHPRRYSMLFTGSRRETVDPLESVGPISRSMLALVTTLQEIAPDGGAGGASADGAGDAAAFAASGTGAGGSGPARAAGLDEKLSHWGRSLGAPAGTGHPALRLALSTWYRVHGLVSLEIVGAFDTMGLDGGSLLTAEINSLVSEAGR